MQCSSKPGLSDGVYHKICLRTKECYNELASTSRLQLYARARTHGMTCTACSLAAAAHS